MKKEFIEANINIVNFVIADVIATSGDSDAVGEILN